MGRAPDPILICIFATGVLAQPNDPHATYDLENGEIHGRYTRRNIRSEGPWSVFAAAGRCMVSTLKRQIQESVY